MPIPRLHLLVSSVVGLLLACNSTGPEDTPEAFEGVWRLDATTHECLGLSTTGAFIYEEFGFSDDGRPADRLETYHRNDGRFNVSADSIEFVSTGNVFYGWRGDIGPVITELPIPNPVRGRVAITQSTLTLDIADVGRLLVYSRLARDPSQLSLCGPRP
jgi:hypothetical protein